MTRTRQLRLALLVLLVLSLPVGVAAAETRSGGTVVVGADETVDEDLTALAGNVVVRGTVNGDLTALAGNVVVSGTVTGDVSALAGNVNVRGTVTGDVSAAGGNVFVEPGADVAGDLEVGGGVVSIDGTVRGTARVGAGELRLGPAARVGGDLEYDAESFAADPAAQVAGETRRVEVAVREPTVVPRVPNWVGALYWLVTSLVVGLVLLGVVPGFSTRVADRGVARPVGSGGVGLLVLVGVPVLLAILAATIVLLPVSLAGFLLYGLALWAGYIYGAFAVGTWLADYREEPTAAWAALVAGLVVLVVVGLVPVVGGVVQLLAFLLGLGAFSTALYGELRGEEESGVDDGRVAGEEAATGEEEPGGEGSTDEGESAR